MAQGAVTIPALARLFTEKTLEEKTWELPMIVLSVLF